LLALALLGLLRPSIARAEEYPFSRVRLLSTGCSVAGLGDSELRGALSSELAASSLLLVSNPDPLTASEVSVNVRLPCPPHSELVLRATFSGINLERAVALDELPSASRPRALALLLAELLAEFATSELAEAAPPASTAPPPVTGSRAPVAAKAPKPAPIAKAGRVASEHRAPERPSAARRAKGPPLRVGAGPELRAFFSGSSVLGGRVHGDWDRFSVGVSVLARDNAVSAGRLSTLVAAGSAAVRALTLGDPDRSSLSVGLRVGLGYIVVTARPIEPNVEAHAVLR
jgi:hypothetical protein